MATVTASYNWVSGETVTPTKLNSTAAPTVVVADNEVTTAKIADGAVTDAKLASGIDASKLTTGTLPIARIADAAITAGKLDGAQTGSAPIYGCRAWVNFDGTSVTNVGGENRCAINASGNVSKVVRNAAGDYTVHFATALADGGYSASFAATFTVALGNPIFQLATNTSASCRFNVVIRSNGVLDNSTTINAMFIR
jgi:hypothetical protein